MMLSQKRLLVSVCWAALVLVSHAAHAAARTCGAGRTLVQTSEDIVCWQDADGNDVLGTHVRCWSQMCNESKVPASRGACDEVTLCPGYPVHDPCGPDSACGKPPTACKTVCEEICGNGLDDDGDGKVDEGCPCTGGEAGCCENQIGHPVTLATGIVSTDPMVDFSLATPGLPVELERVWVSKAANPSTVANFGSGWQSNLAERLTISPTSVLWTRTDGRGVVLPLLSGASSSGFSARFVADGNGYRIIETSGQITGFDLQGRLRSRTRQGHGLANVIYSDEQPRSDCPAGGTPRICQLVDTRGSVIQVGWTGNLIAHMVVAPGTPDEWVATYSYATTSTTDGSWDLLTRVDSPTRRLRYEYSGEDLLHGYLVGVWQEQGWGQPDIALELHDYYGDAFGFAPLLVGRSRVARGPNSALGFRWGSCDRASSYCQVGGDSTGTFGDDGISETAIYDLRNPLTTSGSSPEGTACWRDQDCPTPDQVCTFFAGADPGLGSCRSMSVNVDKVSLKDDRVISRTAGCATCNGAVNVGWDEATGTKTFEVDERGLRRTYLYDGFSRVVREIDNDDDSDASTIPGELSDRRVTNYQFDPNTGLVALVAETSNLDTTQTRSMAVTYTPAGLPSTVTLTGLTYAADGSESVETSVQTATYSYSDAGLLVSIDGPRTDVADVTRFEYYDAADPMSNNRLRLKTVCRATGNAALPELCMTLQDYDLWGNARTIVDANGTVTTRTYDSAGRLLEERRDSQGHPAITTLSYYNGGRIRTVQRPGGGCRVMTYGAFGTVAKVQWQSTCDAGAPPLHAREFVVDEFGRVKGESVVVGGVARDQIAYEFDARSRVSKIQHPSLPGVPTEIIERDALGFPTNDKDEDCWPVPLPSCVQTQRSADLRGRVVAILHSNQDTGVVDAGGISYSYDLDGNVRTVNAPSNVYTVYKYDDFDHPIKEQSSDVGSIQRRYDVAGNLIKDFRPGSPAVHTYDAANRRTRTQFGDAVECVSSPGGALAELRFLYDVPPSQTSCPGCGNLKGNLARVEVDHACDPSSPTGRFTTVTDYGYDALGRIATKAEFASVAKPDLGTSASPMVTTLAYRPDGQIAQITYPDRETILYEYDDVGLTTAIREASSGKAIVSEVVYDDPALRRLKSWKNGVRMGGAQ